LTGAPYLPNDSFSVGITHASCSLNWNVLILSGSGACHNQKGMIICVNFSCQESYHHEKLWGGLINACALSSWELPDWWLIKH
jgi:hypothetical protein